MQACPSVNETMVRLPMAPLFCGSYFWDVSPLAFICMPAGRPAAVWKRMSCQGLPGQMEAGDQPSADLLTRRLDVHEKNAWMLRSLVS